MQQDSNDGIPTRPLGRSGERVPIVGLGGYHIGVPDENEAINIMHEAIDQGMTFFDNAWDYHDGGSEEVMGKALASDGSRDKNVGDRRYDAQSQADLETLIGKTKNVTVGPLQMSTLFGLLLGRRSFWQAQELSQRIKAEHPEFNDYFEALVSSNDAAREAAKRAEWIERKAKSPIFETDEDMRHFGSSPHQAINPDGMKALAKKVSGLDVSKLNAKEQLGRQFILCQAGGKKEDLTALVKLARQHPAEIRFSLQLIEHLTIEKSAALPFVIAQIDPDFRSKKEKTHEMVWKQNAAYSALRSFRTKQTAEQIIKFMNTTTDSLLIQATIRPMCCCERPLEV